MRFIIKTFSIPSARITCDSTTLRCWHYQTLKMTYILDIPLRFEWHKFTTCRQLASRFRNNGLASSCGATPNQCLRNQCPNNCHCQWYCWGSCGRIRTASHRQPCHRHRARDVHGRGSGLGLGHCTALVPRRAGSDSDAVLDWALDPCSSRRHRNRIHRQNWASKAACSPCSISRHITSRSRQSWPSVVLWFHVTDRAQQLRGCGVPRAT